jgi:hypothetical protein
MGMIFLLGLDGDEKEAAGIMIPPDDKTRIDSIGRTSIPVNRGFGNGAP